MNLDELNKAIEEALQAASKNMFVPMPSYWSPGCLCEHEAVDTGMRKSWCKHCDVNMVFVDGAYRVV